MDAIITNRSLHNISLAVAEFIKAADNADHPFNKKSAALVSRIHHETGSMLSDENLDKLALGISLGIGRLGARDPKTILHLHSQVHDYIIWKYLTGELTQETVEKENAADQEEWDSERE